VWGFFPTILIWEFEGADPQYQYGIISMVEHFDLIRTGAIIGIGSGIVRLLFWGAGALRRAAGFGQPLPFEL
jgi:hypothetical protein